MSSLLINISKFSLRTALVFHLILFTLMLKSALPATKQLYTDSDHLSRVKLNKKLTILVIDSPFKLITSDYSEGFNDDLVNQFALFLGVDANIIHVDTLERIPPKIDIIIGTHLINHDGWLSGPPIYTQHYQLVTLDNKDITPPSDKSYPHFELGISPSLHNNKIINELLKHDKQNGYELMSDQIPPLPIRFDDIQIYKEGGSFLPLIGLISGEEDFAITDSVSIALFRMVHPNIQIIGNISENEIFAWRFYSPKGDRSLLNAFNEFHQKDSTLELLDKLADKYFSPIAPFNKVDTYRFLRAVKHTLPKFRPLFEAHAKDFDWRLIAAIAYQESHWDPLAKSPTGVRGMMMLTRDTASYLGIDNRLDTEKSIFGGVQYLKFILDRIPSSIDEDEKIWFALAAYNMGLNHLWDVRTLTAEHGDNPDSWHDVKKYLPMLRNEEIYTHLKFGFARGDEALLYVENIKRYYSSLLGLDAINHINHSLDSTSMKEQKRDNHVAG